MVRWPLCLCCVGKISLVVQASGHEGREGEVFVLHDRRDIVAVVADLESQEREACCSSTSA